MATDPNPDKYDESNRFWTGQAIGQFGTTTNFFFIVSMAFLTFLVNNKDLSVNEILNTIRNCEISNLLMPISVFISLLSVIISGVIVLSRLHDLRLTRHTIWIRKKYYDLYKMDLLDNHVDLKKLSYWRPLKNFISTIIRHNYFIDDIDLENQVNFEKKFSNLRERNLLLSQFSWSLMNCQILTLIVSFIFYIIYKII